MRRLESAAASGEGNFWNLQFMLQKQERLLVRLRRQWKKVFGRHVAKVELLKEVYSKEIGSSEIIEQVWR